MSDPTSHFRLPTSDFALVPPIVIAPFAQAGVNNAVWLVRTGAGEFIWKESRHALGSAAALEYEHWLIEELARQTEEAPQLRAAQRALADDITALVHSSAERDAAVAAAAALFGRSSLAELSEPTVASVVTELNGPALDAGTELPAVVDVLTASGVVASKSAARRAINEGGAYLNNVRVSDPDARITETDLLHGRYAITRRGKRTVGAVSLIRG